MVVRVDHADRVLLEATPGSLKVELANVQSDSPDPVLIVDGVRLHPHDYGVGD